MVLPHSSPSKLTRMHVVKRLRVNGKGLFFWSGFAFVCFSLVVDDDAGGDNDDDDLT